MLGASLGWRRYVPFIGYHHVMMIVILIAIIVLSILLAGCTNTGLNSVYLLSLKYIHSPSTPKTSSLLINPGLQTTIQGVVTPMTNGTANLEVRIGYMGLCIRQSSGWICSSSAQTLADIVLETNFASGDPLNLIYIGTKFKSEMIFNGLVFATIPLLAIAFVLLATFPGWHEEVDDDGSEREVKPFPSRAVSYACLAILCIASLLVFVSIFWQHISASGAVVMSEQMTYGAVQGTTGTAAMVMGWLGVFLVLFAMIGIVVMIVSIKALDRLANH
ncbi:Ca2+ regulator and membrane fusion protein Fig1-domain-containing protein [Bisporella sp. PMI_857]|nr:Ca2+ regulator and membrane fusion protein Fig1-domain-containing protein [Bisporella sp. PMI_857]